MERRCIWFKEYEKDGYRRWRYIGREEAGEEEE